MCAKKCLAELLLILTLVLIQKTEKENIVRRQKKPTKNFEKQELKVSSNQNIWELGTQQSNLVFFSLHHEIDTQNGLDNNSRCHCQIRAQRYFALVFLGVVCIYHQKQPQSVTFAYYLRFMLYEMGATKHKSYCAFVNLEAFYQNFCQHYTYLQTKGKLK